MPESTIFDHYEVLKREDGSPFELGRGAMGITYKAFDTSLRIPVALKVINGAYLHSEVARQRFIREARSAARLRHRHVASVFHLGVSGDTYFYAMEFIDGETVESLMRREGALEPLLALRIATQVTRALGEAQKHGLVHRDIKPANLMLVQEDDEVCVKVIDFGLAKSSRAEGEDATTVSIGGFVGTPYFASPEQLEEKEIDVRSDIYSLGVTLWYMLVGRTPFSGSLAQVMSQHLGKRPPFEQLSTFPAAMVSLLERMLQKDPAKRQQTPLELRREFDECSRNVSGEPAAGDQPEVVPPTTPPKIAAKTRRKGAPLLVALGIGVALAALAAGVTLWMQTPGTLPLVPMENPPEPSPAPSAIASISPPFVPSPAPPVSPTPAPSPAREQILMKQLSEAQGYEADQNWPACLAAYLRIAKDYPESEAAKRRLAMVLERFVDNPDTMSGAVFDSTRESITEAARLDVVPAMMVLGARLQKDDPVTAFNWYYAAAQRGQVAAMTRVGLMYSNGLGVDSDYTKAVEWFQGASDKGDTMGKFCLGECLLEGKGTAKDEPKAIELLTEAAAAKEPRAMDLLGTCYDHGWGVEKNFQEAFRFYSEAVDLHYWDSLASLAALYLNGEGVPRDRKKAADLLLQGGKNGSAHCMFDYARCMESGSGHRDAAVLWYRKAAEAGYGPAMEWCAKNNVPFQRTAAP